MSNESSPYRDGGDRIVNQGGIVVYRGITSKGSQGIQKRHAKNILTRLVLPPEDFVRINEPEITTDNPMNGTTNTSVPRFLQANLVQEGDSILVHHTAADGTVFFIQKPGLYLAKFMLVIDESNAAINAGILAAPSVNFNTDPITTDPSFATLNPQGLRTSGRATTPAGADLPITLDAYIFADINDVQQEVIVADGTTTIRGLVVTPATSFAGGAGLAGIDIATPRENFHFQLTKVSTGK